MSRSSKVPKGRSLVSSDIAYVVQDLVIWHEKLGISPDEIIEQYPTLTLADVYAALAHYWDHREEIEQIIADEEAFVEELKRSSSSFLKEKLGPGFPPP